MGSGGPAAPRLGPPRTSISASPTPPTASSPEENFGFLPKQANIFHLPQTSLTGTPPQDSLCLVSWWSQKKSLWARGFLSKWSWYLVVNKASQVDVPFHWGSGTQRCSEARTQGTKDLRDIVPASWEATDHPPPPWKCSRSTGPSPTSGPPPCKKEAGASRGTATREGEKQSELFPQVPLAHSSPARPEARGRPAQRTRSPARPARPGGARSLGGEQGRRPRGRRKRTRRRTTARRTATGRRRTRGGHTHRRADPAASRRRPRAPAEPPPAPSPEPGRTGEGPLRPQREGTRGGGRPAPGAAGAATMIALFNKLLDWFKALFWKEEMELTLVGLQYSGKTTFVNVIAVRGAGRPGLRSPPRPAERVTAWRGRHGWRRRGGAGPGALGLARPWGPGGARPGRDGTAGRRGGGRGDAARAPGPAAPRVSRGQRDRRPRRRASSGTRTLAHDGAKVQGLPVRRAEGRRTDAREAGGGGPGRPGPTPGG